MRSFWPRAGIDAFFQVLITRLEMQDLLTKKALEESNSVAPSESNASQQVVPKLEAEVRRLQAQLFATKRHFEETSEEEKKLLVTRRELLESNVDLKSENESKQAMVRQDKCSTDEAFSSERHRVFVNRKKRQFWTFRSRRRV